jgi:uncharacterized membrane protein YbhN (UPF0104 family)
MSIPAHELRVRSELQRTAERANDIGTSQRRQHANFAKPFFLAGKMIISAACFWYVLHKIDAREVLQTLPSFDLRWVVFAVLIVLAQIPLLALRLQTIVLALAGQPTRLTYLAANAVTAIYGLFAQALPSLIGEGIRAWMLTRFGSDWRTGLTSVLIDRGVGVSVLVAFAFAALLFPSTLIALPNYRNMLLIVFGGILIVGVIGLLLTPRVAPLLQLWRYTYWIGTFAADAYRALVGPRAAKIFGASCLIHALTIFVIWSISHGQGLPLSIIDCAVLFAVMMGVMLVPISIGGWGLREFVVVSLLGAHGIAPERALVFSVCFGLVLVTGALPGALVWLFYPLPAREISQPQS